MAKNIAVNQLELNDAIIFILSAFSIILAVLPLFPLQERDNQSVNMVQYFRALDITNHHVNVTEQIKAYNKLHESDKLQNIYNAYSNNLSIKNNPAVNLEMAKMYYDKGDLNMSNSFIKNIKHKDKDVNITSWYINRLINMDSKYWINKANLTEDEICQTIHDKFKDTNIAIDNDPSQGMCTSDELKTINNNLNYINEKGVQNDISDSNYRKNSLDKPIENFISILETFIIGSIIVGPITFIIVIKSFIHKFDEG